MTNKAKSVESEISTAWVKTRNLTAQNASFGRSPKLPSSEYFPYACAMVVEALDKNEAARPLWVELLRTWDTPGGRELITTLLTRDDPLKKWLDNLLEGAINENVPVNALNQLSLDLKTFFDNNPDISNIVDCFIEKAFTGPLAPKYRYVMGELKSPKNKTSITSLTAPLLKSAAIFLSLCDSTEIDLQSLDRERMGKDYELVTSGSKPTTEYGRKRKPEINTLVKKASLSFFGDETVKIRAEKWYRARVIRGSIAEAASENREYPGTFKHQIEECDHVAGLR